MYAGALGNTPEMIFHVPNAHAHGKVGKRSRVIPRVSDEKPAVPFSIQVDTEDPPRGTHDAQRLVPRSRHRVRVHTRHSRASPGVLDEPQESVDGFRVEGHRLTYVEREVAPTQVLVAGWLHVGQFARYSLPHPCQQLLASHPGVLWFVVTMRESRAVPPRPARAVLAHTQRDRPQVRRHVTPPQRSTRDCDQRQAGLRKPVDRIEGLRLQPPVTGDRVVDIEDDAVEGGQGVRRDVGEGQRHGGGLGGSQVEKGLSETGGPPPAPGRIGSTLTLPPAPDRPIEPRSREVEHLPTVTPRHMVPVHRINMST